VVGWGLLSSTESVIADLLPFLLLLAFWWFIMRQFRTTRTGPSVTDKLEEIRAELERLRKAIEGSSYR
jgi:hypothetical protein